MIRYKLNVYKAASALYPTHEYREIHANYCMPTMNKQYLNRF